MSEVSALMGAETTGATRVVEGGLQGMITLRGDLGSTAVKAAVRDVTSQDVPGSRGIAVEGERGVAWMSPDELLLLVPHGEAEAAVATMAEALKGDHATIANVSDARALFHVTGPHAREALAKLSPADLHPDSFGPGEMRRTRLAQVPAAIWQGSDDAFSVICFRSVAQYVFDILALSVKEGGEVGYF